MILPSVGAQTGNRLAQMISREGQSQRGAGLDLRRLAFQQQLAAAEEREKRRMLLMAQLQQHAQKREMDRAARRSDVSMSNILSGVTAGASAGKAMGPLGMVIGGLAGGGAGAFVKPRDTGEWSNTMQFLQQSDPFNMRRQQQQDQMLGLGTVESSDY